MFFKLLRKHSIQQDIMWDTYWHTGMLPGAHRNVTWGTSARQARQAGS